MKHYIRLITALALVFTLTLSNIVIMGFAYEPDTYAVRFNSVDVTDDGSFIFELQETNNKGDIVAISSTIVIPNDESAHQKIEENISRCVRNRTTASYYETTFDSSQSYSIYMTVNFDKTTVNGGTMVKVSSVSGGYNGSTGNPANYVGSGVYIQSQSLAVGSSGAPSVGETVDQHKNVTYSKTTTSWSYTAPSSWVHVMQYGMGGTAVGAQYIVTATRNEAGTGTQCNATLSIYYPTSP